MTDAASASPLFQDVLIVNKKGLHARASAKFVQCAERFDATVSVAKDLSSVGGTSIMGLMMLSAGHGATIRITAEGAEAPAALAALVELVSGKFGEEE
jgi:phosphocarrier protein HPr